MEKLKNIFKNFYISTEKSFSIKVFLLVLKKIENIYEFPDIFWNLFDSNLNYGLKSAYLVNVFNKYFNLFEKNIISDSRVNLLKLTNKTFNFFTKNAKDSEIFLSKLEEIMNKDEQDIVLNEPYFTQLYADFLSIYYKEKKKSINDYLINYLKSRKWIKKL